MGNLSRESSVFYNAWDTLGEYAKLLKNRKAYTKPPLQTAGAANGYVSEIYTFLNYIIPLILSSRLLVHTVIWCFLRNMDVMGMAFFQRSRRNLNKPSVLLQFFNRLGAAVAHA